MVARTSTDLLEHINCFVTYIYFHKQVLDDSSDDSFVANCNNCWNTVDAARDHDER